MGKFLFIADNLALDFVNTEMVSDGQHVDALQTPDDLHDWFVQAGLSSYRPQLDAKQRTVLLGEALKLRRAVRAIAIAIVEEHRIPRSSIDIINRLLRDLPFHREIASVASRYQWVEHINHGAPAALLYSVARAAGDLLVEGRFDRVKKCGNPDCILFLYDSTRSHTRHWCSMAGCGNRMKVAAFYERKRARQRAAHNQRLRR